MKLCALAKQTLWVSVLVNAIPSPKNVAGLVKVDFHVKRGSSLEDASADNKPLMKRSGDFDMTIENESTFYMANLTIGSDQQSIEVLVDTGSSDLWVMGKDLTCVSDSSSSTKKDVIVVEVQNTSPDKTIDESKANNVENKDFWGGGETVVTTIYATESALPEGTGSGSGSSETTNTCTQYGTFSTSGSTSYKSNSTAFSIEYADGSSADGTWGYDDVSIEGTTIKSLSFAVVNETSSSIGVLGIGLPGLETTYSSGTSFYMYENLPMKMVTQGIINKSVFSLYLSDAEAVSGSVLFGAVDHAKYSGDLTTVAIVNTAKSSGYDIPIKLEITLSSLKFNNSGTATTVSDIEYPAILDSGSTLSYFPAALVENLASALDGTYSSSAGVYIVECTSDDSLSVQLNFTGAIINVLLTDLLLQTGSTCYLGVVSSSDDYVLFGDNVLRSAYLVYDLEDYQVSLAQAKYTDEEDIEVITSTVPSAVTAQYYSETYSSAGTESSVASGSKYNNGSSSSSSSSTKTNSKSSGAINVHTTAFNAKAYIYSGLLVFGVFLLMGL